MSLTIVNVAYPLAPVRPDAIGGAEQIVHLLDRGLAARGHRSIVIAPEGSSTAGELVATPRPSVPFTPAVRTKAVGHHRAALAAVLSQRRVDVVHLHGHDFDAYLPAPGPPVLVTLHLPIDLVFSRVDEIPASAVWVHGVSHTQQRRFPAVPNLLPPIENGIALDDQTRPVRRRDFALALGRICPEKGYHLALEAARRAEVPLLLGGMVFPYEAHEAYFERELLPRLDHARRFVGPLSIAKRRRLMNAARCLLIPSLVEETSSLVAMEAMACGTPVIAFATGALPDLVEDGVTGFLVRTVGEMAEAIRRAAGLDPDRCREQARARFSASRMVDQYIDRYRWIAGQPAAAAPSRPQA